MTIYHNSPVTGKAARCRAKVACAYGGTFGTTLTRDGQTAVGSVAPTWGEMENPPDRIEERVIIGEDGKATEVRYDHSGNVSATAFRNIEKSVEEKVEAPAYEHDRGSFDVETVRRHEWTDGFSYNTYNSATGEDVYIDVDEPEIDDYIHTVNMNQWFTEEEVNTPGFDPHVADTDIVNCSDFGYYELQTREFHSEEEIEENEFDSLRGVNNRVVWINGPRKKSEPVEKPLTNTAVEPEPVVEEKVEEPVVESSPIVEEEEVDGELIERFQSRSTDPSRISRGKKYEPIPKPLVNNVHVWNDGDFSMGYADSEGRDLIRMDFVDGYPTEETLNRIASDYTVGNSLNYERVVPDTKINDQRGRNARYDELIEQHYGRDLFYLQDEETARNVAEDIAERSNNEFQRKINEKTPPITLEKAQKHMDEWNAGADLHDWKRTMNMPLMKIPTRKYDSVTVENVMKAWKVGRRNMMKN